MPKVLISDSMSSQAADIFRSRGVEVHVRTGLKPDELKAIIGGYDGLAIRSSTKVTADILAAAENLKVIGRAGIGVDNVDVPAATGRGIVVMNTPFGNSITTAEHALAMMMALARQIPQANASTHAGKWEKSGFMGVELAGKTLGIVGCGNIGGIVADRARGLKMKVIAHDPYLSAERAEELGVEKIELDALYARADFISLHAPSTETTRGMINAEALARMKPGVRIINCARGSLVIEDDLKAAILAGKVAGAALDVFAVEPAKSSVLFGLEQVVATPHLGASTVEAQEKVALQVAEQMADFLLTGAVVNALNMPSVSAEEMPRLQPYMKLAGQIGRFMGQLVESAVTAVTIEYEGHAASLNLKPLTGLVLEGLLSPQMETVNMVNAPMIAKARDIAVSEVTRERAGAYQTLIALTVVSENQTRTIAGTLFNGDQPRIVGINGVPMDAQLRPNMLLVTNRDRPGLIGRLGTLLGDAGINIATFNLGRDQAGGKAIALIEIDEAPSESLLDQVRTLPNVVRARAVRF
ncbi:MAG: phosphoglycerate dehydrogenase [Rhodospirillales bacterium]|nr:phosphoglycerate dehydrogenase [Rhodospirillales bacterium]